MDYAEMMMEQSAANSAFNAEQSKINRDWNEYMSSTAHQREVNDLIAAGINPVLSANSGASWQSVGNAAADPNAAIGAFNLKMTEMNNKNNIEMTKMNNEVQRTMNINSANATKAAAASTAGGAIAAAATSAAGAIQAARINQETALQTAQTGVTISGPFGTGVSVYGPSGQVEKYVNKFTNGYSANAVSNSSVSSSTRSQLVASGGKSGIGMYN